MKKSELAAIKQALDGEIKSTEQKIVEYSLLCQPIAPENSIGRVSRMDAINNKTINDRTLRKAEEKLNKLKLSLSRIDDPSFGTCLKCNSPIQEGRLLLLPEEEKCINCARVR